MDDLSAAERQLEEREMSLRKVKDQYEAAVSEKQQLTDAANVCLRKVCSSSSYYCRDGLQPKIIS